VSDLIFMGVKVQSAVRDWIAELALERRTSMSGILRCAITDYLSVNAVTDDEREVALTIKRKRMENVRVKIPKDRYDSFLFPHRVRKYVNTIKSAWKSDGSLTKERYGHLVEFVEDEIRVIEGNPHEELLTEMLEEIIADLRREQSDETGD